MFLKVKDTEILAPAATDSGTDWEVKEALSSPTADLALMGVAAASHAATRITGLILRRIERSGSVGTVNSIFHKSALFHSSVFYQHQAVEPIKCSPVVFHQANKGRKPPSARRDCEQRLADESSTRTGSELKLTDVLLRRPSV